MKQSPEAVALPSHQQIERDSTNYIEVTVELIRCKEYNI